MPTSRPLPTRVNPLMTEEVPAYEVLVARRRLGQTDLTVKVGQSGVGNGTKKKDLGTFDYAHLRAPLPKGIISGIFKPSPASYFLMRRSYDGYISATGMFKATFPYAEASEEETERKYIKSLPTTSPEETAGNVWISPAHALELAAEYQILPWITALLDNTPIETNQAKEATPKRISPPPKFSVPPELLPASATPSQPRRSRRSVSPSKIASPRKIASTRTRRAKAGSVEPMAKLESKNTKDSVKEEEGAESTRPEVKEEPLVHINVDKDVVVNGETETTHTHVEVEMPAGSPELPLPEDTEAMIAKAKEMVEAAVAGQNEVTPSNTKSKRKIEEVEVEDEETDKEVAPVKRAKTESTELKKERIKTRTLIGISATLAIGAAVQYAFSAL